MPRVDQGVPHTHRPESARRLTGAQVADACWKRLQEDQDREIALKVRQIELLEKIVEKLEEIRFGLVDNETGISNLLRQMKLSNHKLEELVDKRR